MDRATGPRASHDCVASLQLDGEKALPGSVVALHLPKAVRAAMSAEWQAYREDHARVHDGAKKKCTSLHLRESGQGRA